MAYGQQHFLVWFFIPATPSYTSFSDFSPSVTRSFIRKKLFFENFMLWYLCCRIWNYGDYGPLGYDLSCRGSHCSVSSTFIRIHLIPLWPCFCYRELGMCLLGLTSTYGPGCVTWSSNVVCTMYLQNGWCQVTQLDSSYPSTMRANEFLKSIFIKLPDFHDCFLKLWLFLSKLCNLVQIYFSQIISKG